MASIISAGTTSGTALNISADTSGQLQLATGASATTALTIDTSQNVGIATTSPATKLDVTGVITLRDATLTGSGRVELSSQSGFGFAASAFQYKFLAGDATTERMRIDSSGNLLVGTTSNLYGSSRLCLSTTSGNVPLAVQSQNGGFGSIYGNVSGTSNYYALVFQNNAFANTVGYIACSGSTTSYATSSDYRLKDNVLPMTGALEKVSKLKPVTYKWKLDNTDGEGFIAHELQAIIPNAVTGDKDAIDEKGNPKYQGIDTSFLVATLTAAIQEQIQIINDLKARIETLEAK